MMGGPSSGTNATKAWRTVSSAPPLSPGDVHLWRAVLTEPRDADWRLLSPDERERAGRLQNADGPRRFVARRAFLRRVLSLYTGVSPQSLTFTYGEVGKPALASQNSRLRFNQSDSGDWSVVAVAQDNRVGVDVEVVRPHSGIDVVAGEVFTDAERAELASVPPDRRVLAFLTGWTRKEAIVKALGGGLALSLQSIEVSLHRDHRPALKRLGEDPIAGWSVLSFDVAQDVLGAVAVEHAQVGVRRFHLE